MLWLPRSERDHIAFAVTLHAIGAVPHSCIGSAPAGMRAAVLYAFFHASRARASVVAPCGEALGDCGSADLPGPEIAAESASASRFHPELAAPMAAKVDDLPDGTAAGSDAGAPACVSVPVSACV